MKSGKVKEVSQAVKEIGISRSTYHKYKDYIFDPTMLAGGSILTITQSLPIHNQASVTISLDISSMCLSAWRTLSAP